MPTEILLSCVAVLLALAGLAVATGRLAGARAIVYGSSVIVGLVAGATAVIHLATGATADSEFSLPLGLPWLGSHFRLDAIAAFFLVIVNLGGAATSLYALGYGRHEASPSRVMSFYPAFLAGMNLVVLADDAFTFLLSWEFMSLVSWALVMAHHRVAANAHAGYVYLLMASFGTLALLLAFGLLAGPDGGYSFAAIRTATIAPGPAVFVLVLALIGAGSKAGLVPLHVWLPLAHPAAPSHVSALMSAVMTKVAIYGFIRIVFDLLGGPAWWWGMIVLVAGGITAVLGVLQALMQGDLKRILAYSTIENIGFIFIGLGLALAFQANGIPDAAALALTAALFHSLNHAIFKSVLFFGAGAVLTATGERNIERLGGLIHRMPSTAVAFLAGCIAISALPPLNGFVSEWLTLQAILLSPALPQWGLKFLVPAIGGLLALSAALAGACFVRVFGVTFLGRPRGPSAIQAREVDRWSLTAMFLLVGLCLTLGVLPGLAIDAMAPVTRDIVGSSMPRQSALAWFSIVPVAAGRSSYNGLLVLCFIAATASWAAFAIHRLASNNLRRAPAWDCGFPDSSSATQYTADSFSQPIRRVFGSTLLQARELIDMPAPGDRRVARFTITVRDFAWDTIYAPIGRIVWMAAERLNYLQFLTIRKYLSLVFVALVALLLVASLWS